MFSKLALFFATAMAIFAVALPSPGGGSGISNSCNGGQTYCCNSIQDAKSTAAQDEFKKFNLVDVLAPISAPVGLTCTPVSLLALQSGSCTTQAACCNGDKMSGLVVVGCSPLNVNA